MKDAEGKEVDDIAAWFSTKVSTYTVGYVSSAASKLEIVISNDFPLFHSYLISEEGLESIDTLIQSPEQAFSGAISEALKIYPGNPLDDFKEASRCLAFGFWTASGFHVVRCAEAVLRKWHVLSKPKAPTDTQWNNRVQELQAENKNEPDQETQKRVAALLNMLDSLRDANRNPLMHPEMSLDQDQAMSLFKLSTSLISSMTREIIRVEDAKKKGLAKSP